MHYRVRVTYKITCHCEWHRDIEADSEDDALDLAIQDVINSDDNSAGESAVKIAQVECSPYDAELIVEDDEDDTDQDMGKTEGAIQAPSSEDMRGIVIFDDDMGQGDE